MIVKPKNLIVMKINIPEIDKNSHIYLGYLGNNGPHAVCDKIVEWIKAVPTEDMSYFNLRCLEADKEMANRFIEANKDNFEVMEYINGKL